MLCHTPLSNPQNSSCSFQNGMEWFISTMQNSSVVSYPLLLSWFAKFLHVVKAAWIFCILFFFLIHLSFGVLVPKWRFIFGFSFPYLPPIALLLSPDSSSIFLHTHTITAALSSPPLFIHSHLALTWQILWQKLFFNNPLCNFCFDFYSQCAEYTK